MTRDPLILASASPRRAESLRGAGVCFEVIPADVDEAHRPGETSEEVVKRLSRTKAEAIAALHPEAVVLAADTLVEHDGELLGKPADAAEAGEMLTRLSGDCHEVLTGFTLIRPGGGRVTEVVVTVVEFRDLSPEDIRVYIASGEPFDKAGGYGIQSGAASFVRRITGSYSNVVGLPLAEVVDALRRPGGR